MTAERRQNLRTVFSRAWMLRREDASLSMADALKASWAHMKALWAFYAQTAAAPVGSLRKLRIKSTVRTNGERGGNFRGNAARLTRGLYA